MAVANGYLFFVNDELWKSDGTESGTVHVSPVSADNLATSRGAGLFYWNDASIASFGGATGPRRERIQ